MLYAIIGKTGKEVQTYTDADKANEVLAKLKDTGATLKVLVEAAPKGIRNAGILKSYRPSTVERILAIVTKGQKKPVYAIYVEGILLAYAPTEETAHYIQRKARGFARRVLQRSFKFTVEKMERQFRKVI